MQRGLILSRHRFQESFYKRRAVDYAHATATKPRKFARGALVQIGHALHIKKDCFHSVLVMPEKDMFKVFISFCAEYPIKFQPDGARVVEIFRDTQHALGSEHCACQQLSC